MLKIIYREDSQLRLYENGKEEILAKKASEFYYLSSEGDYAFYLANSKHWHNGDLYIKKMGNTPTLLGNKVNLIYVSPTADVVVYIDKYFENQNNKGSLYMVRNGCKKVCLDRNVSGTVIVIEKDMDKYKIYYEKTNKKELTNYRTGFVLDEKGNKQPLGIKFNDIKFFRTNKDELRIIGEVTKYNKKGMDVQYYIFHEEEVISQNIAGFSHNDSTNKIIYSEEDINIQRQFFKQIEYKKSYETKFDEIIFQFSSHSSSRYYIACEIIKKAKKHLIVESPYDKDDSINHIAFFSPEQKEDILLLHYTLTTGTDFLPTYKLFGVSVEDLIKNAGAFQGKLGLDFAKIMNTGFMTKDTSEKIMYRNIYNSLLKTHDFQYRQELKTYLLNTYLVPVQDRVAHTSRFFEKYVQTNEKRLQLQEKMKLIEEELILKKIIPSKWKSEYEMFKLIKNQFPAARLHSSPDWLAPQHLDVFIEDLNIAFEYQGEQHFLAIDFFGGEGGLLKRKKLDKRKKDLCLQNGVKLVEWMFYEPVTKLELERKLEFLKP
ncbi:hypothetical protein FZC76_14030 [Sutcliffiella horikoshii]|uniref:Uncharacterized protein n=1 Tax=Sutcliffiella horikoshii TaxID=79883 RepID=A0A5D4SWL5_9BACI|nr:hypothetical protein [Sutcliffiella horikoshii]TYS67685.1 hypothetical protein FZC76_14030 [Sutcliffiella horikoshii]